MRGYVFVFRPHTSEGTIISDDGESLRFRSTDPAAEFRGGDVVSFRRRSSGDLGKRAEAVDVKLVSGWSLGPEGRTRPILSGFLSALRGQGSDLPAKR